MQGSTRLSFDILTEKQAEFCRKLGEKNFSSLHIDFSTLIFYFN